MSDDLVSRLEAYLFCPEHGPRCGGENCCCIDRHDQGSTLCKNLTLEAADRITELEADVGLWRMLAETGRCVNGDHATLLAENARLREGGTMSRADWQWCGHAHHFIGARDCHYHLSTFVGGGTFLVSTVGGYLPDRSKDQYTTLGLGDDSFYESMVFRTDPMNLTDDEPTVIAWSEEWCERYATAELANAGHIALCNRFDAPEEGL